MENICFFPLFLCSFVSSFGVSNFRGFQKRKIIRSSTFLFQNFKSIVNVESSMQKHRSTTLLFDRLCVILVKWTTIRYCVLVYCSCTVNMYTLSIRYYRLVNAKQKKGMNIEHETSVHTKHEHSTWMNLSKAKQGISIRWCEFVLFSVYIHWGHWIFMKVHSSPSSFGMRQYQCWKKKYDNQKQVPISFNSAIVPSCHRIEDIRKRKQYKERKKTEILDKIFSIWALFKFPECTYALLCIIQFNT